MSLGLSRERMNNKYGSGGWGRLGRVSNVQFPRWPFLWGYKEIMKVTEPGLPGSNTWWSEVSWHNNYKNKVHNKCNKSSQNHSSSVRGGMVLGWLIPCMWSPITVKNSTLIINVKLVVTYEMDFTRKRHTETFWIDGNVLCLDLGGS